MRYTLRDQLGKLARRAMARVIQNQNLQGGCAHGLLL
jgi:hypothetical protein